MLNVSFAGPIVGEHMTIKTEVYIEELLCVTSEAKVEADHRLGKSAVFYILSSLWHRNIDLNYNTI